VNEARITIITPTYRRNSAVLRRCLGCVRAQTFSYWRHIICSDGLHEQHAADLIGAEADARTTYCVSSRHYGDYGASVRQEMLTSPVDTEYVMFLDDDNIILPHYLEKMIRALDEASHGEAFAICAILHFGPLPFFFGKPPVLLRGEPRLLHIDTLQVVVRTEAMKAVGWRTGSYVADGFTYQELGKRFQYVRVDECLAIHM